MDREGWIDEAVSSTALTERQAEAVYRRSAGQGRAEAAGEMDISPSNLDNAEREGREKILKAHNLVALADEIGADPDDTAPTKVGGG